MYSSRFECERKPHRPNTQRTHLYETVCSFFVISPLAQSLHQLIRNTVKSDIPFWIVGGMFASERTKTEINDVDVFSSQPEILVDRLIIAGWTETFRNSHIVNLTPPAATDAPSKFQVILRPFATMQQTVESIDFTINAIGYDGQQYYRHSDTLNDIDNKRIVVQTLNYPLNTLTRMFKYAKRGYDIDHQSTLDIIAAIRDLDIEELDSSSLYLESHPN